MVVTALIFGLAFVTCAAGSALAVTASKEEAGLPITDRVIVVWEEGVAAPERRAVRSEAGVAFERDLVDRRFQLVEVKPERSRAEALRELRRDPAVAVAEPDGYMTLDAVPNDPLFGLLWGLRNTGQATNGIPGAVSGVDINALGAWERTVGAPSTVVAVIDTGYRIDHPDLAAATWANPGEVDDGVDNDGNGIIDDLYGADFVGSDLDHPQVDGDPTDDDPFTLLGGHGAHVAGTIGATRNNGVGLTGVANVALMPLRGCSVSHTMLERGCPYSATIAAVHYAGQKGAHVVNMSLGGTGFEEAFAQAIADYPETLFVASAGNDTRDNDATPYYPCVVNPVEMELGPVDNLLCVAATDAADGLASFSQWGASTVDLGAPGVNVLSVAQLRWLIDDDFEVNDFATKWSPSGPDGGLVRSNEQPLSSWGITDSPGAVPVPGTVKASTSKPLTIPPGYHACRVALTGKGDRDGFLQVLLDGEVINGSNLPTLSGRAERDLLDSLSNGGEVSVRLEYSAPAAPGPSNGLWIDSVELYCVAQPGEAQGYRYSSGTSMAAPHVSGVAGLLFSLRPGATVGQVREALLRGVQPLAALAGKTVSGGRLDASAAVDLLDEVPPPAPTFTSSVPASPAKNTKPKLRGVAQRGTSVELFRSADCSGDAVASGTAAQFAMGFEVEVELDSSTQFTVAATDVVPQSSACSAPFTYTESTDLTPPDPPVLTSTNPASPGVSGTPYIRGTAEPGSTVRLYTGALCEGEPVAVGSAGQFASPGLQGAASQGVAVTFSATATDGSGNVSECSVAAISYLWALPDPVSPSGPGSGAGDGGGSGAGAVPGPDGGRTGAGSRPRACVVPRLAGKTLPQARRALRAARCKLGRVRKPRAKPRAKRRAVRLVIKSSTPRRGARPANRRVNLILKFRRR